MQHIKLKASLEKVHVCPKISHASHVISTTAEPRFTEVCLTRFIREVVQTPKTQERKHAHLKKSGAAALLSSSAFDGQDYH